VAHRPSLGEPLHTPLPSEYPVFIQPNPMQLKHPLGVPVDDPLAPYGGSGIPRCDKEGVQPLGVSALTAISSATGPAGTAVFTPYSGHPPQAGAAVAGSAPASRSTRR
jgi:hypothetical protein